MKALILCGGKGSRLRPLTYTRSKQLLPVANRPIVSYMLDRVLDAGIKEIGIIVAPETQNEIKSFFKQSRIGAHCQYITQEQPLGLAHAVKTAQKFIGKDSFIMCLGDNLLKHDFSLAIQEFEREKLDALVFLKEVDDPSRFGVAVLDNKGNIKKLIEKPKHPPSNLALVGVYLFSPKIHAAIKEIEFSWRNELEITDAIQQLIKKGGKVRGKTLEGWWLDTGKKDDLLSANSIVLDEFVSKTIKGKVDAKSTITGRVFVDRGARIINSTLRGPAVIGKNVVIKNSLIGSYTSIGDNAEIVDSDIEHSVILQKTVIKGISRLEDSLIGEDTQVMAHGGTRQSLRLMLGDSAIVEVP